MKIIVAGNLIDTDYIYKISEIDENSGCFRFCIYFVNKITLPIEYNIAKKLITLMKSDDSYIYPYRSETPLSAAFIISERNKFIELRNKLIKIWSNNQSTIPKLDFDSLDMDDNDDTN